MKKLLFSLLALCLLAIVSVLFLFPYGLGFIAENKYKQVVEALVKSNAMQITLLDYHRGWFSSEATLKVELPSQLTNPSALVAEGAHRMDEEKDHLPLQDRGVKGIIVKQHIEHGPIFSLPSNTHEKHLALGQALVTTQVDSVLGFIEVVSRIKLNGALKGTISAPKLVYTEKQNMIALSHVLGTFAASADLNKLIVDFRVPQLVIKTDKFTQQTDQIRLYYNLKKSHQGLFLGQYTFTFDAATWNANTVENNRLLSKLADVREVREGSEHRTAAYIDVREDSSTEPTNKFPTTVEFQKKSNLSTSRAMGIKLQRLKVEIHDEEKDHKLKSTINGELKFLTLNNATYGPEQLALTIDGLDIPTLLMVRKELNNLRKHTGSPEEKFKKYQALSAELLSHGLTVKLQKLQLVTPWGAPSLVADFVVPAQQANDMASLIRAMNLTVEINTPASFLMRALEKMYTAQQNPAEINAVPAPTKLDAPLPPNPTQIAQAQITDWVNKKWLLPKDNGYQMIIVHQNQQTTINAQPINTPSTMPATAAASSSSQ